MINLFFKSTILLFVLFLFCGCGSLIKQPPVVIEYYQLDYKPEICKKNVLDKTIAIRPFYIAGKYNRTSIMYSDDKYTINFYPYKQWISSPQEQLTELIRRDFINSDVFKAVILPGQLQRPNLILSGAINEIKEVRKDDKAEGVLKVTVTLIKPAIKKEPAKIIFQKDYEGAAPCDPEKVESLVEALSAAAKKISSEILFDITAKK